jgi:hypothetical protein
MIQLQNKTALTLNVSVVLTLSEKLCRVAALFGFLRALMAV